MKSSPTAANLEHQKGPIMALRSSSYVRVARSITLWRVVLTGVRAESRASGNARPERAAWRRCRGRSCRRAAAACPSAATCRIARVRKRSFPRLPLVSLLQRRREVAAHTERLCITGQSCSGSLGVQACGECVKKGLFSSSTARLTNAAGRCLRWGLARTRMSSSRVQCLLCGYCRVVDSL